MRYLGVAVAVVIVVLLVAVFVLPNLTGSSSGGAAAVLTYSGALPVANGAVSGFAGGGWTPVFAAGVVSAMNETEALDSTSLGNLSAYCSVNLVAGNTNLTVSAYSGSRSSGASPAWVFGYRNQSEALAVVSVLDGHPQVLFTMSGLVCSIYAELLQAIPGTAIDSSQAAAAVEPDAAAFLAAHPNASAEYALIGGIHEGALHLATEWSILYSSCPLSPSASGTGDEFNATVNATSGQVLSTNTSTGVSCGGTTVTPLVTGASGTGPASLTARSERPNVRS